LHRWLLAVRTDTDLSRQGFEQLLAAIERGHDTKFSLGVRAFAVVRGGKLSLAHR
jgi:tRNA(Ile)-lysidine synthase